MKAIALVLAVLCFSRAPGQCGAEHLPCIDTGYTDDVSYCATNAVRGNCDPAISSTSEWFSEICSATCAAAYPEFDYDCTLSTAANDGHDDGSGSGVTGTYTGTYTPCTNTHRSTPPSPREKRGATVRVDQPQLRRAGLLHARQCAVLERDDEHYSVFFTMLTYAHYSY